MLYVYMYFQNNWFSTYLHDIVSSIQIRHGSDFLSIILFKTMKVTQV